VDNVLIKNTPARKRKRKKENERGGGGRRLVVWSLIWPGVYVLGELLGGLGLRGGKFFLNFGVEEN